MRQLPIELPVAGAVHYEATSAGNGRIVSIVAAARASARENIERDAERRGDTVVDFIVPSYHHYKALWNKYRPDYLDRNRVLSTRHTIGAVAGCAAILAALAAAYVLPMETGTALLAATLAAGICFAASGVFVIDRAVIRARRDLSQLRSLGYTPEFAKATAAAAETMVGIGDDFLYIAGKGPVRAVPLHRVGKIDMVFETHDAEHLSIEDLEGGRLVYVPCAHTASNFSGRFIPLLLQRKLDANREVKVIELD
jgi:hypothetical protein